MTGTASIKLSVRKAFETALKVAMTGATPPVACAFENLEFDATKVLEYAQISISFGPDKMFVIGPDPRIISSGFATVVVRVQSSTGTDRADRLAGIVAAAYPYNAALVRDGISVIIGTSDVVQGAQDGPWWMVPIKVNWTVWN